MKKSKFLDFLAESQIKILLTVGIFAMLVGFISGLLNGFFNIESDWFFVLVGLILGVLSVNIYTSLLERNKKLQEKK